MQFLNKISQEPRILATIAGVSLFVLGVCTVVIVYLASPWKEIVTVALFVGVAVTAYLYTQRTRYVKAEIPKRELPAEPHTNPIPQVSHIGDEDISVIVPHQPYQPPNSGVFDDGSTKWDEKPGRRLRSLFLFKRNLFRHIKSDENGTQWLVVASYMRAKQGKSRKKKWVRKEYRLRIVDNPYVTVRFITKARFIPTDGETEIHHFKRLNWWSYGKKQLGIVMLGLFLPLCLAYLHLFQSISFDIGFYLAIIWVGVFLVWFYTVWIKWAYRFLIITNKTLRAHYRPPLNLPNDMPDVDLKDLTSKTSIKSTWWGNNFGYGTISAGTAAESDKWIEDGIAYVSDHENVAAMIDQLREYANA